MEELRLTVVSDATQEFPQNQNNRFKVRLPRPLHLPEGPWAMSLWSLSVPDGAVERPLGQDVDYLCMFGGIKARIWNYKNNKYRSHTVNTWIFHILRFQEINKTPLRTGVELWQRIHQVMLEQQTKQLGADRAVSSWQVQQPEKWYPTIRWEGDDMILEANRNLFYQPTTRHSQFLLPLKMAQIFGFMKQDPKTQKWSLGPNLIPSYPLFNYTGHDITSAVTGLKGPTQRALATRDVDKSEPFVDWFRVVNYADTPRNINIPCVDLSTALEWRFIRLNRSYEQYLNRDTVLVYTDVVQPNTVNRVKVPLLRSVQLNHSGQGRLTVEPLHREWIPLNGNTLELMEFQCASPSGPLIEFPPGQTIVTVGLKPIKTEK